MMTHQARRVRAFCRRERATRAASTVKTTASGTYARSVIRVLTSAPPQPPKNQACCTTSRTAQASTLAAAAGPVRIQVPITTLIGGPPAIMSRYPRVSTARWTAGLPRRADTPVTPH